MLKKVNLRANTMISIQNLTKGFGREILFKNINMALNSGERIALVGKNGAGKTTFLKCLVGLESFDGRISLNGIEISLMEQEKSFDEIKRTFKEYLEDKKSKVEERKAFLEKEIGNPAIYENEEKFTKIIDEYSLVISDSSVNIEIEKIIKILKALGLNEKITQQNISQLSGGEKVKLRLAECLAKKADLYLLDEPTNHLDLESCEWLERYIQENIKSLMVISHDRYFLNKIITKVIEIENQSFNEYKCGYEEYEDKRRKHLEIMKRDFADATKKREKMLESAKEKRLWASKYGNKTKRIIADRLERQAEELEAVPDPDKFVQDIEINFSGKELHNCEIFRINNVKKAFDNKVLFENVNLNIENGEKIAIIGGNGSGKTTFLKMLTGREDISNGDIERKKDINIGYFDQELKDLNQEDSVIKTIIRETGMNEQHLISVLLNSGFNKESFSKKIYQLSGGEKARFNLLRISLQGNAVLLLDEPTNNLDIYLRESLEKALKSFPGTVIFVSHDRYFIDKVASRILEIKNKKISSFRGNYSEYLASK